MTRIIIRPDRAALCWTATFAEGGAFVPGTYPLPFTLEAPVHVVAADLRHRFPNCQVTGVQGHCEGCAS